MPPAAIVPLPAELPLRVLFGLPVGGLLGVWMRGPARTVEVRARRAGVPLRLLAGPDLGLLLRRCPRVAVRAGGAVAMLPAVALLRLRALHLRSRGAPPSALPALRILYPDLREAAGGIAVPLGSRSPEEVLAGCVAARLPVLASRVVYPPFGLTSAPGRL